MVRKKKFTTAALYSNNEIFIVYIASFIIASTDVYPSCRAPIILLIQNKAPIIVLSEYADFADILFLDLATELPK